MTKKTTPKTTKPAKPATKTSVRHPKGGLKIKAHVKAGQKYEEA